VCRIGCPEGIGTGFQRIGRRSRVREARCVENRFVVLRGVARHDAVICAIRRLYHGSQGS